MTETVNITVKADNTQKVIYMLNAHIASGLAECGLTAEGYAKKDCPVDTGYLRSSITHKMPEQRRVQIGTNCEYAKYVELNDRVHHPVGKAHFLRDSILNHKNEYVSIVKKHL